MTKMVNAKIADPTDFMWLSQLRFIFQPNSGEFGFCIVRQTNCTLEYSYEYQGNNGRLVVTPLTDRCVLTLVTAMFLYRGGNPLGPAGTGKTETVKDLGKNLAKCKKEATTKSVLPLYVSSVCLSVCPPPEVPVKPH